MKNLVNTTNCQKPVPTVISLPKIIMILGLSLMCVWGVKAFTCVAVSSTNWETATTWSTGQVPTCGDSVFIPVGITVTITSVLNYTGCVAPIKVTIAGNLDFQTGKKIKLPCGSIVYILAGGTVNPGNGGGHSDLVSICGNVYWDAANGTAYGPLCWGCAMLPIELSSLTSSCSGNVITLDWSTASEINNHYFLVERSDNGLGWTEIAQVEGAGTSSVEHYYTWSDNDALPGTSYYRLKQVDFDGNSTYSSVISVACNSTVSVVLFPNPSAGDVYCKLTTDGAQTVTLKVADAEGKCVSVTSFAIAKGTTVEKLTTGKLKPGTYTFVVNLVGNIAPVSKTFIVE